MGSERRDSGMGVEFKIWGLNNRKVGMTLVGQVKTLGQVVGGD